MTNAFLFKQEIAISEKENTTKSLLEDLEKRKVEIEQLKQQNDRVLRKKNQEIARLELGKIFAKMVS